MRLGDPQIREQEGHGLRTHRTTPIGVDRQLVALDALLLNCLRDQLLGHGG
jgi:hypothetical protein